MLVVEGGGVKAKTTIYTDSNFPVQTPFQSFLTDP